jgi:predicted alpha/beta-hydrolase family hydrolase
LMPHSISVADSIAALPKTLQAPSYMKRSGEQQWSTRRMRVAHKILSRDVGVVCTSAVDHDLGSMVSLTSVFRCQEALIRQLHDLQELLSDE